jgi:putative SOS response-associated peptidase YedK
MSLMKWGLIPSWSKDPPAAAQMINARSETAGTKPAFRDALRSRRCLIPGDGFYEWKRDGKTKQPYCFEVNDGTLFAFAGLEPKQQSTCHPGDSPSQDRKQRRLSRKARSPCFPWGGFCLATKACNGD